MRRRLDPPRAGRLLAAALLALAVVAAAATWLVAGRKEGGTEAERGRPACVEPWSTCSPDARWLQRALANLPLTFGEPTGSALTFEAPRSSTPETDFLIWTTPRLGSPAAGRIVATVAGTPVRSDGIRVMWVAAGRRVWLEPEPESALLARIVRATRRASPPAS
jgi:hypothetical protein